MAHYRRRSSLCNAALANDYQTCRDLSVDEQKLNEKHKGNGATPLICASQNGNSRIVKMLLEKENVEINAMRKDGSTALICAARNGHTDVVELLLKHDAQVNLQMNDGSTALIYAAQLGFSKIVELLLKFEADDNLRRHDGASAMICAEAHNYSKIVQMLIDYDLDSRVTLGSTRELSGCFNHEASLQNLRNFYDKTTTFSIDRGCSKSVTTMESKCAEEEEAEEDKLQIVPEIDEISLD